MFLKDKNKQSKNISDTISGVIFTIFAITMDDCGMFSIYGGGSDDILLAVLGWVSTAILDL